MGYLSFSPLKGTPSQGSVENSKDTSPIGLGTYALVGRGAGQSGNYAGTVRISSRTSTLNVFDVTWNLTSGQIQNGVGILAHDILSVSYYETDEEGNIKDIGVVSYRVIDSSHLQGEWTSAGGGTAGVEQISLQPQI